MHRRFDHQPYVSVENVSRRYEPGRVRRIEHVFALLGGIVPGEGAGFEDEDEDLFEDADEESERVSRTRVALDDVSFEATGGSCVALVGPPRAGKSVLMRIIAGLAPPTNGRVVVHGRVAAALDSSVRLFPRGVRKLGAGLPLLAGFHGIPPRIARKHLQEVVDFLDWPDLRKEYISLVSRKNRRSLMLTMALHVDADIVLIDGAIPAGAKTVDWQERMLELKRAGVLLILTARDVESVSWIADRALHMEGGVIVRDERIAPTNEPPALRAEVSEDESELLEELVPVPGEVHPADAQP